MPRRRYSSIGLLVLFALAAALSAGRSFARRAEARPAPPQAQTAPAAAPAPAPVEYQRSYRIDHYLELSDSGVARGENIYFHKCWVCHNQYQSSAPRLTELMQGGGLGADALATQIKNGGVGMPSFRSTLSEKDLADLVRYMRAGKCCFEGDILPVNPQYRASAKKWTVPNTLSGGARGRVRTPTGEPVEGMMVQLIAPNGVRTTVYSDFDGKYEFPEMRTGAYTLRIASPLEFKPYTRGAVQIDGAAKLDDIVLENISDAKDNLAPAPEAESQLSGAELLWNLPGTAKEKDEFKRACGEGCHSYQQIFRNRYDERSWRVLVSRMLHRGGGPLINPPAQPVAAKAQAEDNAIAKWLSKVRGPDSQDEPLIPFPRPAGAATRVVVTEYELPRVFYGLHDVVGDSEGRIWYTSHMTRYVGRLDPATGEVTEYQIPLTQGALPGTHHVVITKDGTVLFSENWAKKLLKFDPKTEQFSDLSVESPSRINSGGFGNFALAPDGFIWAANGSQADKLDPQTGRIVQRFPFKGHGAYDSLISDDGNLWAGGSPPVATENTAELLDLRSGEMLNLNSGAHSAAPRRGGFDPFGNAWFGGMNGTFVELDAKAKRLREFWPPTPYTPYTDFYTAIADKNGEVWSGELHGRGFLRFNPQTGRWVEYTMPEPFAHARGGIWIDNSSNPITLWYADYSLGRVIRIQPME